MYHGCLLRHANGLSDVIPTMLQKLVPLPGDNCLILIQTIQCLSDHQMENDTMFLREQKEGLRRVKFLRTLPLRRHWTVVTKHPSTKILLLAKETRQALR